MKIDTKEKKKENYLRWKNNLKENDLRWETDEKRMIWDVKEVKREFIIWDGKKDEENYLRWKRDRKLFEMPKRDK